MACELCGKSALNLTEMVEKKQAILEIIRKHIPFLKNYELSCLICQICCDTLRNFHELYVLVENTQKSFKINDPLEFDFIKLETKYANYAHTDQIFPLSENETNRPEADLAVKIENSKGDTDACELESRTSMDVHNHKRKTKKFYLHTNVSSLKKDIKPCLQIGNKVQKLQEKHDPRKFDDFLAENFKLCCNMCSIPIKNFAEMKTHFRKEHNIDGFVLCCGKKFRRRYRLVDHVQTHLNPNHLKCPECNKVLADRRGFQEHTQLHQGKPERIFQCTICSKSYQRRSSLARHMQEHVSEEEKTINCPECRKIFSTFYLMHQHLKTTHLNIYSKMCDICGKSIRGSRAVFQQHQQEHNGFPKPVIECEICGLKLTSKYGLNRHIKVIHLEKAKPQTCTICSKVYPTIAAYKSHMNYVHNLKRKHQCSMCDKAFKKAQALREHMATHTGEVLYTCPNCPITFISNANMHSHRKKVHRKEWEEVRKKRQPRKFDKLAQKDHQHSINSSSVELKKL